MPAARDARRALCPALGIDAQTQRLLMRRPCALRWLCHLRAEIAARVAAAAAAVRIVLRGQGLAERLAHLAA